MQKHFQIKNKRGLNLAVVLELPSDVVKCPMVMLLHGFKGYKEEETYTDLAAKLVAKGIGAVSFDASGFGESEGTLEDDYRFSNYSEDAEIIYEWLMTQDFFDRNNFGVCGQSMGGAQAILFSANHPHVKAVCSISPPDKVGTKDALGKVKDSWRAVGYLEEQSSKYGKMKIPYSYLEDAMKYDFVELVRDVASPILIVLGEKDSTVLPIQSEAIYTAANDPKELMRLENMDHFYKRNLEILNEVNEKVVSFFNRHLIK